MALRKQDVAPAYAEPIVLVRDVLAEAAGVDPGRSFDLEAARVAKGLRRVTLDWAGRPWVPWSAGRELLESLKGEQRRANEEHARRIAEADAQGLMVPSGIVQLERPGEPTWTSPNFVGNPFAMPSTSTTDIG